ncbi:M1 family metallopeptidase [Indiicoccus explosivorum]|uniref:M1 family metallopeptidase n=1 Tax=Indiicoccus explosivorum TaxID=1917864 RepID=UPI000B438C8A|nr:M1 family metallopeptidase [Indiicoccus explosivorum]
MKNIILVMAALVLNGCSEIEETQNPEAGAAEVPVAEQPAASAEPEEPPAKTPNEADAAKPTAQEEAIPIGTPSYTIGLAMDESGEFDIRAQVSLVNESGEPLQNLGFYFVPNVLTEEGGLDVLQDFAELEITAVTAGGMETAYDLSGNRLIVQLPEVLEPGGEAQIQADYAMTLPENSGRLSKEGDSYFLAQWYPMLGRYNGDWMVEDFDIKGESYDAIYGDFLLEYKLPRPYLVASSAVDEADEAVTSGTLEGKMIKDFYLAFLGPDDWTAIAAEANETELRIFMPSGTDYASKVADSAVEAFTFFEQRIGDNPAMQLDIIANNGAMEYPNIVEVRDAPEEFEPTLVHEIGHQWFYYLVSNDPFHEAFLDEGITEWASAMYLEDLGDDRAFELSRKLMEHNPVRETVNMGLDEFDQGEYYSTVYGKVPLLLEEYFDANGGHEQAYEFLAAYYDEFQYEYVDTETFAAFFEQQLEGDQQTFLNSWLKLEE